MSARLFALVLSVWASVHPRAPGLRDAPAIARAWVQAVEEDPRPPVLGSVEADTAAGAYWAIRESWLNPRAVGDGGKSRGVWQLQSAAGAGDLLTQARGWRDALHEGARTCSQSPAAPLSGGCVNGRRLADRRVAHVLELLERLRPRE